MKSILVLLLFMGMFMIVHGFYEQQLKEIEKNPKVEYRFVPRSYYEEQLLDMDGGEGSKASLHFKDMFQKDTPWMGRAVGMPLDGADGSVA